MNTERVLGDRYELGELIGYGGMAEVHVARDLRLGRTVAVKMLRPDLARDKAFLTRFRREAQAVAGLNHPSIVAVYDTGEEHGLDGNVQPYIVMEYVKGRTVREILKAQGRLPARRAMEIAADVCGALDFSHANGIVHRDVKPANIMITDTGAVKVMDFGIARAISDEGGTITQTANVIGTAQYLSPEQARGEAVDPRADVYAVGCVLYEMVTGVPPFQGDSPVAVAYQHVRENPAPPSQRVKDVPRAVDSIVMKALAKNPLNRYQSTGEMRSDLQRALADQPVNAEAVLTDAERTQMIAKSSAAPPRDVNDDDGSEERRRGLIWLAVVIGLLVVIGASAFAILFLGKGDKAKMVTVPNIIGSNPAVAAQTIRNAGLVPVQGAITNGPCDGNVDVQEGQVCKVDPSGNASVKDGSKVTYQVYQIKTVQIPNVKDLTFTAASTKLNALQLKPVEQDVDNPAPAGTVVGQTPAAFGTVKVGTTVTLQVSTGKVKLPDVTGQPGDTAKTTLNSQGWTQVVISPTTTPTPDKTKDGTVASMDPSPNISYPQNTQITLTLYKYQAPALAISTASLPNAKIGTAYTGGAVTATGGTGPYAYAMIDGTLPTGLTFNTDGTITGTPVGPPGVYTFTVQATDSSSPAQETSKQLTITLTN